MIVSRALENALRAVGCEVVTVTTASEATRAVFAQVPDLMILDLTLETVCFDTFHDGFAVLNWLHRMLPEANFPVIIHTVDPSPDVDDRARKAGAFAVVRKGDRATDIVETVRQAFAQTSPVPSEDTAETRVTA